ALHFFICLAFCSIATASTVIYTLSLHDALPICEYALKVTARGYEGEEVDIVIDEEDNEFNLSLSPFYSYPGDELAYDDGTGEGGSWFHEAGSGWGVRMSLPEGKDKALVTEGKFLFSTGGGDHFQVEVYDASGPDGEPGK